MVSKTKHTCTYIIIIVHTECQSHVCFPATKFNMTVSLVIVSHRHACRTIILYMHNLIDTVVNCMVSQCTLFNFICIVTEHYFFTVHNNVGVIVIKKVIYNVCIPTTCGYDIMFTCLLYPHPALLLIQY